MEELTDYVTKVIRLYFLYLPAGLYLSISEVYQKSLIPGEWNKYLF
jgi:hypothetical protein